MSEKDDGGPAFPVKGTPFADLGNGNYTLATEGSDGMTLRDYFAAKALAAMGGLLFKGAADRDLGPEAALKMMVQSSYEVADAMLEARK